MEKKEKLDSGNKVGEKREVRVTLRPRFESLHEVTIGWLNLSDVMHIHEPEWLPVLSPCCGSEMPVEMSLPCLLPVNAVRH